MPLIPTHTLTPSSNPELKQQIYNALDCCLTHEIFGEITRTHNQSNEIYDFELALQAPALEMMLRGVKIDQQVRAKKIQILVEEVEKLQSLLNQFSFVVWDKPLNPRSTLQLQKFFYEEMLLPKIWVSQKGEKKLSMGREALEKLELYLYAKPFINLITAIRERKKLLEVLETQIDSDGRYRTSFNIGGTETGRWSSSKSSGAMGDGNYTGGNLQNWTPELRDIVVADEGYKYVAIDLEQAESRELGWLCGILFNDWNYYDACLQGDLHTITCRLVWPNLEWTGDLKLDRPIAEGPFYRHFSYRDMSKRGGHGTNYYGTPFTMSRHLKVKTRVIEEFQKSYFNAYPGIPQYHRWVSQQLGTTQSLTTVFGRKRHFFGRANDDTTLREAIAFSPQSATADRMNLILWRLWKYMGGKIQLAIQIHDAIYAQIPEEANEEELVNEMLGHFHIDIKHEERKLLVSGEAKTGWNLGAYHPDTNPLGLKKFKGKDSRVRPHFLDRAM